MAALGHILDFEFWQHIEYFPSHREVLPGVLDELMGMIVHSHVGKPSILHCTDHDFSNYLLQTF